MDDKELLRLRHARAHGEITVGELKQTVIEEALTMGEVDIHDAVGGELELISDLRLRDYMHDVLARVPQYYWHIPASVMGFHDTPEDNLMGGLVRHSRKVARVARNIGDPYNINHFADEFVIAGLLHDAFKYGLDGRVPSGDDHATFAVSFMEQNHIFDDRPVIKAMIKSHNGRWGRVWPQSDAEWAFHMADFVVSRGASPTLPEDKPHRRRR